MYKMGFVTALNESQNFNLFGLIVQFLPYVIKQG